MVHLALNQQVGSSNLSGATKSKATQMTNDGIQIYYVRESSGLDANGKPMVIKGRPPLGCVAIGKTEDGKICRGISIRSPLDNWAYKAGSNKAIGRCRQAMGTKKSAKPIGVAVIIDDAETTMDSALWFLQAWRENYPNQPSPDCKVAFNVTPTAFELDLFRLMEEKRQGQQPPVAEVEDVPTVPKASVCTGCAACCGAAAE